MHAVVAGRVIRSALLEPALRQLDVRCRRSHDASAPVRQLAEDRREREAVLGQLVDGRGCGRRKLAPGDDAATLEILEAGGEDVRPATGERPMEVGVPQLAVLEELAHDEQRPALTHEVEGGRDRAVLVVALHADLDSTASDAKLEGLTCNSKVRTASVRCSSEHAATQGGLE